MQVASETMNLPCRFEWWCVVACNSTVDDYLIPSPHTVQWCRFPVQIVAAVDAAVDAAERESGRTIRAGPNNHDGLIHQNSSFRPRMHLHMQALSSRHDGTYASM